MQQCKSFFIFTSSSGQGAAALLPAHSNRQESRIAEAKMIRQIIPSAFIHPLVFGFFFSISMISADISFSGSCSWIVISVCLLFSVFRLKILIFILIFLPPFHRQRFFHKSHSNLRIILPEIQPHTCHHILIPGNRNISLRHHKIKRFQSSLLFIGLRSNCFRKTVLSADLKILCRKIQFHDWLLHLRHVFYLKYRFILKRRFAEAEDCFWFSTHYKYWPLNVEPWTTTSNKWRYTTEKRMRWCF